MVMILFLRCHLNEPHILSSSLDNRLSSSQEVQAKGHGDISKRKKVQSVTNIARTTSTGKDHHDVSHSAWI